MHHRSTFRVFMSMLGVFFSVAAVGAHGPRFTVQDSIGYSSFAYSNGPFLPAPGAMASPDGKWFVAATLRGDLASGKRETTLWLFDAEKVRAYIGQGSRTGLFGARPLARFASASNLEPMAGWRWSSDSKSVLFLGADDDGAQRIYRVDIAGGGTVPLSRSDQDVSQFEERNGMVVYLAHAPIRANDIYQGGGTSLPDAEIATGKNILPLLFPNWMDASFQTSEDELWKTDGGEPVVVLGTDRKTPIRFKDSKLILSPDGRQVAVTLPVKRIPKSWERYQPLIDYPGLRIVADTPATEGGTGAFRPKQFMRLDLASGALAPLVDAPIELNGLIVNRPMARWNTGGSGIALASVYPPLDAAASGSAAPVLPCELAVFEVRSRNFDCLRQAAPIVTAKTPYRQRRQLIDLEWRKGDSELVARYVTPNEPDKKVAVVFVRKNGAWTHGDVEPQAGELTLAVREALDEPPVLTASIADGPAYSLLDPNPQLKRIARGKAQLYRWKDAAGDAWEGALVTPPDFVKTRRYPLVIQTHGMDRAKYLVDGPSSTGYAARALAARDIVVLQVQEISKNSGTPEESETGAAGYRAAVGQLVKEGTVDPAKVGIITWSHFGPHAMQGLIDEPHAYAAATWAEAAYNSYGEYLTNIDYMGGSAREMMFRAQVGTKPFGDGLKVWMKRSPGFNTDRVCTPLLFLFNSPPALVYSWDAYAAIRAQNKPVELFYLRNGEHVLVKPRQRIAEQGMNVDWYDYWLNGHKDPDPSKAEQYKRWDTLKALPRCGDSTPRPLAVR